MNVIDNIGMGLFNATGSMRDGLYERYRRAVVVAGVDDVFSPERLAVCQLALAVGFPLLMIFAGLRIEMFAGLIEGGKAVVTIMVCAAVGFYLPWLLLKDRIKKAHAEILLELPDAMDLLTIAVDAGLDFNSAMKRVIQDRTEGRLTTELQRYFRNVELGRTRREALKEFGDRMQLADVTNFTSALIQADKLGASVAGVLRTQSDLMRIRRTQRAEKAAAEAPVKMLAPLVLFIFPSVFLVILGPIFIKAISDIMK